MMTLQTLLIALAAILAVWFLYRRTIVVPAMIDLEATDRELREERAEVEDLLS
jgi:undecaprenyl pyrophosphate phosphatase UppP